MPARIPFVAALLAAFLLAAFAFARSDPARLAEARALLRTGANAEAAALLAARVAEAPADGAAWFLYGQALHAQADYAGSLAAHRRCAELPGAPPAASYNAACALARLGRADEAFAWLEKARAAGFANWAAAANDPDFASLRDDPRMQPFTPVPADDKQPFAEPVAILHDLYGESAGDQYGWVARPLGDVDDDQIADYAVTAPFHGGGRGAVYAHSGASGARLFVALGEAGEQLGWCVAGVGDQNGDGRPDLVAGAPGTGTSPGAAHVLSGADGVRLRSLRGEAAGDQFGKDVRGVGDQDGDGVEDLLAGAPQHDGPAGADAGRATLFSGRDGRVLRVFDGESAGDQLGGGELAGFRVGDTSRLAVAALEAGPNRRGIVYVWSGLTGELEFVIDGDASSGNVGWFLSVLGDVDGDGTPDLYASDWHDATKGPLTGKVRVVSGRDGATLYELVGTRAGEGFGIGIAAADDLDRDGRPDLVVGAWQCAEAAPAGGKVTLFSGRSGTPLGSATGRIAGDVLGFDAAGVADCNGDGVPDLLVTSAYNAARGVQAGRTYVISGASLLPRAKEAAAGE